MKANPNSVYIFNVGSIEHRCEKGSAGVFIVKACEAGEPFSEPLILPALVGDSYVIENEMKTHYVTGEYMAQDIVRPQIGNTWSFGQNLDDLGVFWTKNVKLTEDDGVKKAIPQEKDLTAARGKMEVTFRKLLTMATTIETNGNLNDITPLMRIAATYFGEDRPWNRMYKKLAECPNCGEPAKPGIITHSCGYIFDLDRALVGGTLSVEKHAELTKLRRGEHDSKKPGRPKAAR